MIRSIIAIGLAFFAVASFAKDPHGNALKSQQQQSVVKEQLADAEEFLRSRPGGNQDSTRDSSDKRA
jgi:hypothetical protein